MAAAQLLDVATASDVPETDRIEALDKFLDALRADKSLLLSDASLWPRLVELVSVSTGTPAEVVVAALRVTEEVVCRVQGLGEVRWGALAEAAGQVAEWLERAQSQPGKPDPETLLLLRQAIIWTTNALTPAYGRVATNPSAAVDLWATFERIRTAILNLWNRPSADPGILIDIVRWVTEAARVESWAQRDAQDRPVAGQPPAGEVCLEMFVPQAYSHLGIDRESLTRRSRTLLETVLSKMGASDRVAVVAASCNALLLLIRSRAQYSNLVLLGLVEYWTGQDELASNQKSPWTTQQYRSIERTIRNTLLAVFRYTPGLELPHPAVDMMMDKLGVRSGEFPQPYYLKLRELRAGGGLKREGTPDLDDALPAKRPRNNTNEDAFLSEPVPGPMDYYASPPVPAPPPQPVLDMARIQQIITLMQFDTSLIPLPTVIEMILHVMRSTPDNAFNRTITFARNQIPTMLQLYLNPPPVPETPALPATRDPRLGRDQAAAQVPEQENPEDEGEEYYPSGPAPAKLQEPSELDGKALSNLRSKILDKVLSADSALSGRFKGARPGWEALVGRLAAHGTVLDGEDGEQKEMDAIVEYAAGDFRVRAELAVSYLYQLWYREAKEGEDAGESGNARYFACLHKLLDRLSRTLDPRDRNFTKFLLDAPALDDACIDQFVAGRFITDKDRMQLGVTTLRDMVNFRPALRDKCLVWLLKCCTHPDKATRQFSIQTCRRWVPDNPTLSPEVEKAASDAFLSIGALELDETDATPEDALEDDLWGLDTGFSGNLQVTQQIEFFLALCSKDHGLLNKVFELYPSLAPRIQQALRHDIHPLVRNIGMHSPILLNLLREYPHGSEGLALKCMWDLLDRGAKPTKELVGTWRNAYLERQMDARSIIPVLPYLEKSETMNFLPDVFALLPEQAPEKSKQFGVLKTLVSRLVSPPSEGEKPLMSPAEIMIAMHNMEETIGVRKLVALTQICFGLPDLFKSEQLAIVLQQLVDQPKLPTIMMRTVLQCISQHKSMVGFLQNIMTRLINKRIWLQKQLWEGFIRACKMTQPQSSPTILQLPRPQMEEVLLKDPALRKGVASYIHQLPPSQRNTPRMQGILQLASEVVASPVGTPPE